MNAKDFSSYLKRLVEEEKRNINRINERIDIGKIFEELQNTSWDEKSKTELAECFVVLENLRLRKLFWSRSFYEKNMALLSTHEKGLFQKILLAVEDAYTGDAKIMRDWAFGRREHA